MSLSTEWLHIEDVLPLWGTTEWLHIENVFPRSPFHFVETHRRCVSTKWLHIEDVLPLRVAHLRCATPSGCTSTMCYPFGLHIYDVLPLRVAHLRCATDKRLHVPFREHIFDVPFHKVVAHRRCVSAKRLHIEDVLPLRGTDKRLHME
jgi:hypothetical protein